MVFDNKASWQEAMDMTAAPPEMMLPEAQGASAGCATISGELFSRFSNQVNLSSYLFHASH
jgi:hypothetical protein